MPLEQTNDSLLGLRPFSSTLARLYRFCILIVSRLQTYDNTNVYLNYTAELTNDLMSRSF